MKDPVLFSYHLGDLDDFFFPDCQWAVVYEPDRTRIAEAVLVYYGGDTPTVQAFGLTEAFKPLLEEVIGILPQMFYAHFQVASRDTFGKDFEEQKLGTHLKMYLKKFARPDAVQYNDRICRLDRENLPELHRLYSTAYPQNYFIDRMLDTGKYFGIFDGENLVAVSGVHVDSYEYQVAVLGNIAVHPDHREQGIGTVLTAHLVHELLQEDKRICLNVAETNKPAIKCYKKLGFAEAHRYEEALFTLRR